MIIKKIILFTLLFLAVYIFNSSTVYIDLVTSQIIVLRSEKDNSVIVYYSQSLLFHFGVCVLLLFKHGFFLPTFSL